MVTRADFVKLVTSTAQKIAAPRGSAASLLDLYRPATHCQGVSI